MVDHENTLYINKIILYLVTELRGGAVRMSQKIEKLIHWKF